MTHWNKVEPIFIKLSVVIPPTSRFHVNDPNSKKSKDKLPITKQKLGELVRECIEVQKLSLTDTVITLSVSLTTVLRVCRTLKIGRYSDKIPSELRSNSSRQPYGWKSVNGLLEKEPDEWQCVELMFKFREQGLSLHKIAAELTHHRIPTKNCGKWFAKSVSQILSFNETFFNNRPSN